MPTFRNTLSVPSPQVVSTNVCSGTSTHKIQTPVESPRRNNIIVKLFPTNCLKLTQPYAVLSKFQTQLSIRLIPCHDVTQPPVSITPSPATRSSAHRSLPLPTIHHPVSTGPVLSLQPLFATDPYKLLKCAFPVVCINNRYRYLVNNTTNISNDVY